MIKPTRLPVNGWAKKSVNAVVFRKNFVVIHQGSGANPSYFTSHCPSLGNPGA
jgi:hypothetical protein